MASVTDSVSLSDSVIITPGICFTDALTLNDAVKPLQNISLRAGDTILFTDGVIYTDFYSFVEIVGDSLNLSDGATTKLSTGLPVFSDTLSFGDTIGIFHGSDNPKTDSLSLSDSVSLSLQTVFTSLTLAVSDTFTLYDSVSFGSVKGIRVGDLFSINDGDPQVSLNSELLPYLRRYLNDVRSD